MHLDKKDYLFLYLDDNRLIKRKEVMQLLNISRSTLYRWIKAGAFPDPINNQGLTHQALWRFKDVDRWLSK